MNSASTSPSRTDSGLSKRPSKKWTEQEMQRLVGAISGQCRERINWAEVAKDLPGRTGKQCREKWKNDLRPDICKDPWTAREEYILARLHSEVGNQWAEIAKYLPGRSENSIKNHWNATLRSKAESKARTLLGAYGRIVVEQNGMTSPEVFDRAVEFFSTVQGVEPLEPVPEEYFQRRSTGQQSVTSSPVKVKIGKKRSGGGSRGGSKRTRYDSDDSLTEDDGGFSGEEEGDGLQRNGSRTSRGPSSSQGSLHRRSSSTLPPLPPHHHLGLQSSMGTHLLTQHYGVPDVFHGAFFHGDAAATIKITGRPPKTMASQGGPMGVPMMYPSMMHPSNMAFAPQHHRGMYPPPMPPAPVAPRPTPEAAPAPTTCGDWNQNDMSQMFGAGPDDLDGFTDADLAFLRDMVDGNDDIDASAVVSTAQPKLQVTPGTKALESFKDFQGGEPEAALDYDATDLYYASILPPGPSCLDSPLPTLDDESPRPACKAIKDEPVASEAPLVAKFDAASKLVPTMCGGVPLPPPNGASYMHMAPPNSWPSYDSYANMLHQQHAGPPTANAAKGSDANASSTGWPVHPMAAAMHHHQMMSANAVTSGDARWPSDCYMGFPASGYHHHMMMAASSRSASAASGMISRSSSPALPEAEY